MKNKRFMSFALAAVVTAAVLAGCGSQEKDTAAASVSDSPAESTTAGSAVSPDASVKGQTLQGTLTFGQTDADPVDGGTLVVSMPSSPLSLDPVDYSSVYENHVMYNVLESLFIWDKEYQKSIPCLATDYTVSEDGLSYTVNLRDDVYFQNGTYVKGRKMTAEDVKYSLERSKAESATDRICRDFFDYVEVVNDSQVILHMTAPAGPFITQLTESGTAIVPKEEVEGWGSEFERILWEQDRLLLKRW